MIIFWFAFSEFNLEKKTLLVNFIEKFGTRIRFSKDPAPIDLVCDFPKTVNLSTDFTAQQSYWLKNSLIHCILVKNSIIIDLNLNSHAVGVT